MPEGNRAIILVLQLVAELQQASFAHRRKKLANSLELAGLDVRGKTLPNVRAEELPPQAFLELAETFR